MDTKAQSLPTTHTHSTSRPQGHSSNCGHHCRSCNPSGHASSSSSPSPGPPARHPKQTMHSRYALQRPSHSRSFPRNRKTLEGKVIKRKRVRRGKRARTQRAKRRTPGRRSK
uniref:Nuclear transition protein 2 n=1 Tax=Jaculus jaculus TaxID=51337 RepID=A0A8C5NZB5_JACJA